MHFQQLCPAPAKIHGRLVLKLVSLGTRGMSRTLQGVMEELLRKELSTNNLVRLGRHGGGCISEGQSYETDFGRVFVKHHTDPKVRSDMTIYRHV